MLFSFVTPDELLSTVGNKRTGAAAIPEDKIWEFNCRTDRVVISGFYHTDLMQMTSKIVNRKQFQIGLLFIIL